MTEKAKSAEKRVIETTIEINAPKDAVWKALTDAEELVCWFPLKAEVKPGPGGSIWMSWGLPWEGSSRIEVWEPEQHLSVRGFIEHDAEKGAAGAIVVDYHLESRGGKTVLRLVHSGFEPKESWEDEMFDGTRRGWRYELRSLRHYLERHRGEKRLVAWPRVRTTVSAAETWKRMMGPQGFLKEGRIEGLGEGDSYRMVAATGETFEGQVVVNDPPFEFSGTVKNLNDGLLALRCYEICATGPDAGHEASVWLSTYGMPPTQVEAFRERWEKRLQALLAA
jgi:uncharacterized protein YndB with AHSA1/START domain